MIRKILFSLIAVVACGGCGEDVPSSGMDPSDPAPSTDPDGGPGGTCPIESAQLRVAIPYASLTPPTVVQLSVPCVGTDAKGYRAADVLWTLADGTGDVTMQNIADALYYVDFTPAQAPLSDADLDALTGVTGVPFRQATTQHVALVAGLTPPHGAAGYDLPSGVTAELFMSQSSSQPSRLRFSATKAAKAALDTFFADLDAGVDVEVQVGRSQGAGTYAYTLRLQKTGTKLAVTAIQPVP
jgi:hypothetical protein